MKTLECDILVVGAGPAGSSAAAIAAAEGMRVLVVERRARVGVPVQCAEYIPAPLVGVINLDRQIIAQPILGMRTFLPSGEVNEIRCPGFTIYRDQFDQLLARTAENAGAVILRSTRAVSRETGSVIVQRKNGERARIRARIIIGADGPHSTVGRWIGITNQDWIPAIQVRVPLVKLVDYTEIYFEKETYAGYSWLFPKGNEANVGLGRKSREGKGEPMRSALTRLVKRLVDEGKITDDVRDVTGGWIPVKRPRRSHHDNVILVGDAAGQTHPITGAGIQQAVICGRMAGKWASRAGKARNDALLEGYEKEWQDLFGETLDRASKRRELLEQEWHHLEEVIKYYWIGFKEYYEAID